VKAPAVEIEHAYARCEEITRATAANFYYGIRLLPAGKRRAMSAVYALARHVDDIGDEGVDRETQLAELEQERRRIEALRDTGWTEDGGWAEQADPVMLALAHASRHYGLPLDAFEMLIDSVEADVRGTRYETFDQLVGYCRGVAGSIGRLCLAIFTDGASAEGRASELADDLGVAMQLTNILRDVREDAGRGRSYLPEEDLRKFGCLEAAASGDLSPELIRFQALRAQEWFDRGLQLVACLDARSAACVLAMTGIYRRLLERILRDPARVTRERVSLPAWEKTWVALHSLAGARPAAAGSDCEPQPVPAGEGA
jgi:phytoene synthase